MNLYRKKYLSAPLPFVGQKRMFAKEFIKVLKQFPDDTVFVDLFGGSGLLSHIAKYEKPNARVIYNDFDNYQERLRHIPETNALLHDLRAIIDELPRHKPIVGEARERILQRLSNEHGYIDFITLSSSLMFSMKYCLSLDELRKEGFYNNVRKTDYPPADDYLEGIEIESCDYKLLVRKYKHLENVVFLVDPPYLSTDVSTYKMSWTLKDYLDVLKVLHGSPFIYFTSNKSNIIELCEWLGKNPNLRNPFEHCEKVEFNATLNYNSHYMDMMFYTRQ